MFWSLKFRSLEFVSYFVLRISNLGTDTTWGLRAIIHSVPLYLQSRRKLGDDVADLRGRHAAFLDLFGRHARELAGFQARHTRLLYAGRGFRLAEVVKHHLARENAGERVYDIHARVLRRAAADGLKHG